MFHQWRWNDDDDDDNDDMAFVMLTRSVMHVKSEWAKKVSACKIKESRMEKRKRNRRRRNKIRYKIWNYADLKRSEEMKVTAAVAALLSKQNPYCYSFVRNMDGWMCMALDVLVHLYKYTEWVIIIILCTLKDMIFNLNVERTPARSSYIFSLSSIKILNDIILARFIHAANIKTVYITVHCAV